VPIRSCIVCGTKKEKEALLRITLKDGRPVLDRERRMGGRGAYLCPRRECLEGLMKRKERLSYALRRSIPSQDVESFVGGLIREWGEEGE